MAAAYAALVSVMNVIIRIQHPTCPASFDKSQIQSLFDKVSFMVDFVEDYSERISKVLERKMADVAYAAQDTIEFHVVDGVMARCSRHGDGAICENLEKSIQELDLILEAAEEVKSKSGELPKRVVSFGPSVAVPLSRTSNKMVGLDQTLIWLMDKLTGYKSSREIIPVVGMGGSGKTTLTWNAYTHPHVENYFHVRAWVKISPHYAPETIFRTLLCDIGVDEKRQIGDVQAKLQLTPEELVANLGETLYKYLFGRKYLIVLDDVWSDAAWDKIGRYFPDNSNGSRILLTTRLSTVALSVGSCVPCEMKLLDDSTSWELFSNTVFGQEVCPPLLWYLGKQIVWSCKGLPLAIVVIGGLLKMSDKTQACWEDFARDVSSIIHNDQDCLELLSLSYRHLPIHLKPCFLYMAAFMGDAIPVSNLIELWVTDGFLKPVKGKVLEEVGVEYLNDLIGRNLIMVEHRGIRGNPEACTIHDLLKDFCLEEAQNDNFLCHTYKEEDIDNHPQGQESERRLVYCRGRYQLMPYFVSYYRSSQFSNDRMLQVLHGDKCDNFKIDLQQLAQLRYLVCTFDLIDIRDYPISLFWNLETLMIKGIPDVGLVLLLPAELWELHNLRNLSVSVKAVLPDPRLVPTDRVLDNLLPLSGAEIFTYAGHDEVLRRIPNLKELSTSDDGEWVSGLADHILTLSGLHKLEKLSVELSSKRSPKRLAFLHEEIARYAFNKSGNLAFSRTLRELKLSGSYIPWEHMTVIGSLPNLEVLGLKHNAFVGDEWNSNEGEFKCLKYLSIQSCSLRIWSAESYHFPQLEQLILMHLDLEEIPLGIGEVIPLKCIQLLTSVKSVVKSAEAILEERENLGYNDDDDDLLVNISFSLNRCDEGKEELEKLRSEKFDISIINDFVPEYEDCESEEYESAPMKYESCEPDHPEDRKLEVYETDPTEYESFEREYRGFGNRRYQTRPDVQVGLLSQFSSTEQW